MADSSHPPGGSLGGVCVLLLVAAALTAPAAAHATFPGRNGWIVFAQNEPVNKTTLWRVDPRTGRTGRLTRASSRCGRLEHWEDSAPAYSPAGRQILYVHHDACGHGEREAIYRMRADGTQKKLLVRAVIRQSFSEPGFRLYSPSWSPDGRGFAFTGQRDYPMLQSVTALYLAGAEPQGAPRVTQLPVAFPRPTVKINWGPARLIASDGLSSDGSLELVNPTTAARKGLLRSAQEPDWSPHSSWIAFSRSLGDRDAATPTLAGIYIARKSGRGLRRVVGARGTKGYDTDQKRMPVWSPDGRQIAYIWDYGERSDLYVGPARGGRKRRLAKDLDLLGGLSWQARPPRR